MDILLIKMSGFCALFNKRLALFSLSILVELFRARLHKAWNTPDDLSIEFNLDHIMFLTTLHIMWPIHLQGLRLLRPTIKAA